MRISGTLFFTICMTVFLSATACPAQDKSVLVRNLEGKKKQVVVAYGTSLTAAGAWVAQLQAALDKQFPGLAKVVNSGGSGKYSDWGVANLEKKVLAQKPDTVFLEFCINDSVERFHCTVDKAKANLTGMIQRILKSNPQCEIVLMTMTPGDKYPAGHRSHRKDIELYYEMYRSVAKEQKLKLIDHYASWKALQQKHAAQFNNYVPDTIHPTPEGNQKIVTPAILKALGLPAGQ